MLNLDKYKKTIDSKKISIFFLLLFGLVFIASLLIINGVMDSNSGHNLLLVNKTQVTKEARAIKEENMDVISMAGQYKINEVREIDNTDYVRGDINAPVQLIFYGDFGCYFSREFNEAFQAAQREFGDNLVVSYRHFLLNARSTSMAALLASECAGEQKKFWEMHNKLFEDNRDNKMNEEEYMKDAREIGLDMDEFELCMEEKRYKEKIKSQILEAAQAGVTGTPTSFINGQIIPGALPYNDYSDREGKLRSGLKSIIEKNLIN